LPGIPEGEVILRELDPQWSLGGHKVRRIGSIKRDRSEADIAMRDMALPDGTEMQGSSGAVG